MVESGGPERGCLLMVKTGLSIWRQFELSTQFPFEQQLPYWMTSGQGKRLVWGRGQRGDAVDRAFPFHAHTISIPSSIPRVVPKHHQE